ncbi:hypothetical protein K435DRAFT_796815 [Dendrothele bispora CBS 962.96]|uniref:Uncharacterized protein n=1 Tax=Dendrothele bispora (strain CBS 962.96) TaxID=1314807 RepID=A0A4S8M4K2_DENBC|nr:hypothetical protein K435DRAFT_796815 [Dendrothele bispora CBS 962.96]
MSTRSEYQGLIYTSCPNGISGIEDVDGNQGPSLSIQNNFPNHSGQPDFTTEGGNVQTSDNFNANLSIYPSFPELSPWDETDAARVIVRLFFGAQSPVQAWSRERESTGHLAGLHINTSLNGIAMPAVDTLSVVWPTSGISFTTPLMTPDTSPTTPGLSPAIFGISRVHEFLERESDGDINQIQDAIQDHSTNEDERTVYNVQGHSSREFLIQGPCTDSAVNAQVPQSNIGSEQVNTSPRSKFMCRICEKQFTAGHNLKFDTECSRVDLQFISGDGTLVSDRIIVKSVRTRPPHHGRSKDMSPQFTRGNWKNCPDLTSAAIRSGLLIADFPP